MATIRTKLKQLKDADVRYISLVDRAATRIPFRVLKRNKETEMGIDLMRVFKKDAAKPFVSALVVLAPADEASRTKVTEVLKREGFEVDRVQKGDNGETMVFPQADAGETMMVRLGDKVLANVSGLTIPQGWMGDLIGQHGFFPDLKMAAAALHEQMVSVAKSDMPQADAKEMLSSFGEYLGQVMVLPAACFSLNESIGEVVTKGDEEGDVNEDEEEEEEEEKPAEEEVPSEDARKSETEAERKKRLKNHPPSEMAPADEEDDQKPPPETVSLSEKVEEKVDTKKSEDVQQAILSALSELKTTTADLKTTTTSMATKLESVATEQAAQKKVLDGVVQKADTLTKAVEGTVVAPVVPEDRPAGSRMRVEKKDEDPRTGTFDTGFMRKRR